jgi:alkylated DNA repair dioxygenase AlkB
MQLFAPEPNKNLLPFDGLVNYHDSIIETIDCMRFFSQLRDQIEWKQDEVIMFGKRIVTARKTAWYGDRNFPYTYSRITRHALPWTPALLELKALVEKTSGETYNACLMNLYHNGNEGMAWHSDDEVELKKNAAIASLSLGAERRFDFKHKTNQTKVALTLENGSLLVMKGSTQAHWLHRLPPTAKVQAPRINLTFRTIAD